MTDATSWTNAMMKQDFQYHRNIRWAVGLTDDPPPPRTNRPNSTRLILTKFRIHLKTYVGPDDPTRAFK